MKFISPIQSYSDIITNSSSEIFLMKESDAHYYDELVDTGDCISIELINDLDFIKSHWYCGELFCDYLGVSWEELISHKEYYDQLIGLYIVDIEDHFSGCQKVYEAAREDCLSSQYCH